MQPDFLCFKLLVAVNHMHQENKIHIAVIILIHIPYTLMVFLILHPC